MVKTPRTRHSKAAREPLTIDMTTADDAHAHHDAPPSVFHPEEAETVETPTLSPEGEAKPDLLGAGALDPSVDAPAADASSSTAGTPAEPSAMAPETKAERDALADSPADDNGYGFDKTDRPATRPAEPAPVVPPRKSASAYIAAGIAGGVVALVLMILVQWTGLLSRTTDSDVRSEVAALRQEIETLRVAGVASDLPSKVDSLSAELDAVKSDLATLKAATGSGGDPSVITAIDDRLKQLEGVVAGMGQGAGPAVDSTDIAALGERIAAIEALVKAAGEGSTDVATRLAALEQSVAALAGRVDTQAQQPKIALAIATAALKAAIDRGTPFSAELETFAAIAPDAQELAALRPFAEAGVATREALLAESDQAASAMIAAASPKDPNAGLLDRLWDSAGGLVTVRPIGDAPGTGVPEIVSRMQAALHAGDLQKAVAEYETLPDASKAAGAPFVEKLKARLSTESVVDRAIANAMKA